MTDLGIVDRATLMLDAGEAQDAESAVMLAGGNPGDSLVVDAVKRLHAFKPDPSVMAEPMLQRFADLTGATDYQIGELIGLGRRGVQAVRTRVVSEALKPRARKALRDVLERVIINARGLIVDLEKPS